MRKFNIFIAYFLIGVVSAIPLQLFPLVFKGYGFDVSTVTFLITLGFIAVIFQPIIGFLTDKYSTKIKTLKILLIVGSICLLGMFFVQKLAIFSILLVIVSAANKSLIPLIDGFATKYSKQLEYPYSKMRAVFSVGFGSSAFITLILVSIFQLEIDGVLLVLTIMSILCFISIVFIEDYEKENIQTDSVNRNFTEVKKTNYINFILLLLYFLLYPGIMQINATYMALHLREFEYSYLYIAIINITTLVSQIYLVFNYEKIFGKLKSSTVLMIAAAIGFAQVFTYTVFIYNPILLLVITMLSGAQFVIFPAAFFPSLNRSLKTSFLSTGFTITTTLQVLWVGFFNQTVVSRVLGITGSTTQVYMTITIMILTAFIPIIIYRIINKEV